MKIRHSDFLNGGEVDFGAWHHEMEELKNGFKRRKNFSLHLRRKEGEERVYEVYKRFPVDKSEAVVKEGTLKQCVTYLNKNFNYADETVPGDK